MQKTNKEHLIEMVLKELGFSDSSKEVVEEIFKIINEYDWAVFCSYMADYDCPGERVQAKKVLDEKSSFYKKETFEKIWSLLKEENSEIHKFYNKNFHNMDKEFVE